jgi:hypothetical protein
VGIGRQSHGSLTADLAQYFPFRSVCLNGKSPIYSLNRKLHGFQHWPRKFEQKHFLLCRKSNGDHSITQRVVATRLSRSVVERNSVNANLKRKIVNRNFRETMYKSVFCAWYTFPLAWYSFDHLLNGNFSLIVVNLCTNLSKYLETSEAKAP